MKFKGIEKVDQGKFITRYNLIYETEDNRLKKYEMISRSSDITELEELRNSRAESVVMIMHDKSGEKLLLQKEFRMTIGKWVYNFPAGMIDSDELLELAANRELFEETGLHIEEINEILPGSYSAVGITNEKNMVIIGKADGEFQKSNSTMEEIEAKWFTKDEVKKLIQCEPFSARAQIYCYLWSVK